MAMVRERIVPRAILFDLDETLTDRTQSSVHYAERFQCDFTTYLASTAVSMIAAAMLTADVRGYRPREEILRDFAQRLPWRTVPEVSRLRMHWDTCFPLSVVARAGHSPWDCHQWGGAVPGAQDQAVVDWPLSVHGRDFRGRAGAEARSTDFRACARRAWLCGLAHMVCGG